MNGIVGDVTPGFDQSGVEGARLFGESIAKAAMDAMNKQTVIEPALLRFSTTDYVQKIRNRNFELAYWAGLLKYDAIEEDWLKIGFHVRTSLVGLGQQAQMVLFPGESLTYNGLAIKAEMKAPFKLFLGLMGDTLGYFVPSAEWNKAPKTKNYEETVSMGPDAGDHARDALLKLIQADNAELRTSEKRRK